MWSFVVLLHEGELWNNKTVEEGKREAKTGRQREQQEEGKESVSGDCLGSGLPGVSE